MQQPGSRGQAEVLAFGWGRCPIVWARTVIVHLLQEVACDIYRYIGAAAQDHEGSKGNIVFFAVAGKPGVRALINLSLTGLTVDGAASSHCLLYTSDAADE